MVLFLFKIIQQVIVGRNRIMGIAFIVKYIALGLWNRMYLMNLQSFNCSVNSVRLVASEAALSLSQGHLIGLHPEWLNPLNALSHVFFKIRLA